MRLRDRDEEPTALLGEPALLLDDLISDVPGKDQQDVDRIAL